MRHRVPPHSERSIPVISLLDSVTVSVLFEVGTEGLYRKTYTNTSGPGR